VETRAERDIEDDADRKVIRDVVEYGWHVVAIPPEGETPGWLFSIGMYKTFGHPEIAVFGLEPRVAHWLINEVGSRVKAGTTFCSDAIATGLLENVTCIFRPVLAKWYRPFFGTAIWYYMGVGFPMLQCIWPDHEENYPWDVAFRESWRWAQPLLFHDSPKDARVVELLASME